MTTLVLININVHTKFEMPSFTHSKDIIKTLKLKKNWSHDPDYVHY